jgi:hypothetical protein
MISDDYLKYLGESIFETAFAHESGPKGRQFDEKNRGSKIVLPLILKFSIPNVKQAANITMQTLREILSSIEFLLGFLSRGGGGDTINHKELYISHIHNIPPQPRQNLNCTKRLQINCGED